MPVENLSHNSDQEWLGKAYDAHDPNIPYITIDPLFDFVREEERFKNILNALSIPE
jgi:hypothetical protein